MYFHSRRLVGGETVLLIFLPYAWQIGGPTSDIANRHGFMHHVSSLATSVEVFQKHWLAPLLSIYSK